MTSPDQNDLGRAPWHTTSDKDGSLGFATADLDEWFVRKPERGVSVDRLVLALLLVAVFVAVPLGLLVLQSS